MAWSRSPAPGTPTRASALARARTMRAPISSSILKSPRRSKRRFATGSCRCAARSRSRVRRRKPDPAALAAPDDPQAARLAALKLLNRRDYGAGELSQRLVARGFERSAADAAVAELVKERL